MRPRLHGTLLALALAVNVALWGCAGSLPKPFPEVGPVSPPPGCETLRERGGEC